MNDDNEFSYDENDIEDFEEYVRYYNLENSDDDIESEDGDIDELYF